MWIGVLRWLRFTRVQQHQLNINNIHKLPQQLQPHTMVGCTYPQQCQQHIQLLPHCSLLSVASMRPMLLIPGHPNSA